MRFFARVGKCRGWGEDPAKIEAVIRDDAEVLAMWREAMKEQTHDRGNQHTGGKHDNVMAATRQGNSRAYTCARLQREAPELFEEVKAGRMSANKAAIAAGFSLAVDASAKVKPWRRCSLRGFPRAQNP